ncbi:hypothetical protein KIN20_032677 [Parelaphostrongylus tenuis]|uniref:Uncharacterized protein n=1 Tax=Parelaphostrongylus tenuis TaxID=148309 RepID=A0AAD5R6T6_PARTN|nr:hypothetical protein KIN20_032677 [Parelaphostrongylus tenuis]
MTRPKYHLFHLCSGHAIARKLARRHYIRSLNADGFYIGEHLEKIEAIFPRLADTFTVLETWNECHVPFAQKNGVMTCCEYEDPARLRGRTEQFIVLEFHYAQNVRYFEDMLSEIRQILEFSADIQHVGNDVLRQMNIVNDSFMCAHIRRSDFLELNVASDFNSSVLNIYEIATQQKVKYSMNSEGVDLYLASKVCGAMLITAPTSTFGPHGEPISARNPMHGDRMRFDSNQFKTFSLYQKPQWRICFVEPALYFIKNTGGATDNPRFRMTTLLLACLATFVSATVLNNEESRNKRSTSDETFVEKLKEGNDLLKNVPNANDTMELLLKLHDMEKEIIDQSPSEKPGAEVLKAMEDYAKMVQNNKDNSIPKINADNKVGNALFQGDMLLTKEQAEEILEDVEENEAKHKLEKAHSSG